MKEIPAPKLLELNDSGDQLITCAINNNNTKGGKEKDTRVRVCVNLKANQNPKRKKKSGVFLTRRAAEQENKKRLK